MRRRILTGKRHRLILTIAAALTGMLGLGGCADGPDPGAPPSAGQGLEPVELIWYYPQYETNADLEIVNEEVNRIAKARINATVRLKPVDFGSYEQKLNTIVAASEPADIVWTSNWLFPWATNVRKGAFLQLDELLAEHGRQLAASMPERFWNDAKLDGRTYGVPNYQIAAMRPSLAVQKRFADKYGLDARAVRKIEDIEPFLKRIKEGEPGIVPFGTTRGFYSSLIYGIDWKVPVYRNDKTHKVLPDVTPEMRENFALAHNWYTKGYINEDAATLRSASDAYNNGNTAVWFDLTGKPGAEAEFKAGNGGYDVMLVPLAEPVFTGAGSSMNAIGRNSAHPERAMMFLELVNTDKELYNTLVYGIEGRHYTKAADGYIALNRGSGYLTNTDWVFGNIRNAYLTEGSPADKIEETIRLNEEAAVSPYNGFEFNTDPVKTELANVKAVNDEYFAALATGTVDPDRYLPIYEEKLKSAGSDVIVAEKQRQLDEWLAGNGLH